MTEQRLSGVAWSPGHQGPQLVDLALARAGQPRRTKSGGEEGLGGLTQSRHRVTGLDSSLPSSALLLSDLWTILEAATGPREALGGCGRVFPCSQGPFACRWLGSQKSLESTVPSPHPVETRARHTQALAEPSQRLSYTCCSGGCEGRSGWLRGEGNCAFLVWVAAEAQAQ